MKNVVFDYNSCIQLVLPQIKSQRMYEQLLYFQTLEVPVTMDYFKSGFVFKLQRMNKIQANNGFWS